MKSGDRVQFSHTELPKLGTMQGVLEHEDYIGGLLFMPDPVHHDDCYRLYGIEPEAGLFVDGATITVVSPSA